VCTLFIALRVFGRDLFSPAVLFIGGFTLSVFNGLTNYNAWNYQLHANTVILLCGCSFLFLIVALFIHVMMNKKEMNITHLESSSVEEQQQINPIRVSSLLGIFGLGLTVLSFVMMSRAISVVLQPWGGGGNILQQASLYNEIGKLSSYDTSIGGITGTLFGFSQALFYVWAYIIIYNFVGCGRKIDRWSLINLLATIPPAFLTGARTEILLMAISAVMSYFVISRVVSPTKLQGGVKIKTIIQIFGGVVGSLMVFYGLVFLLGRDTGSLKPYEYISIYLGAPVKNLDSYLNNQLVNPITFTSPGWGQMTFFSIYETFNHILNIPVTRDLLSMQPFQRVDGSYDSPSLGNVYTTLYPFIFDWGYFGCFVVIVIFAGISQIIYELAKSSRGLEESPLKVSILVYGVIAYGLLFSFFSNRLINQVVSSSFIRKLIIWIVLALIFSKGRLSSKKNNVAGYR
jgi:oligosaccharide repeat unit polymerase